MGAAQQAADVNAAYEQNAANSIIAFQNDIEANQLDHIAAQENSGLQQTQLQRDGLVARAAARADAGSRGVGGLSMAAIHQALGFQSGENVAYAQRNAQLDEERARMGMRASADVAQSRINSAPKARAPSPISLATSLAGNAVSAFSMGASLRADEAGTKTQIAANNARQKRGT